MKKGSEGKGMWGGEERKRMRSRRWTEGVCCGSIISQVMETDWFVNEIR